MVSILMRLNRLIREKDQALSTSPDENKCLEEVKLPVSQHEHAAPCMIKKTCPL